MKLYIIDISVIILTQLSLKWLLFCLGIPKKFQEHDILTFIRKRSTRKRRPKHEAPKTRKRSTLDRKRSTLSRKRSTQNSKTKTPKSGKRSTLDRKRSTQKLETGLSFINTRPMLIQQESSTITNSPVPHHRSWFQAVMLEHILPGSDLI